MNNIVCIGAGQTGRGFIGRFFCDEKITFLDKNKELVNCLQKEKGYKISFGMERDAIFINNYDAYYIKSGEALFALQHSNLIIISVGKNNVKELFDVLSESLKENVNKSIDILVCENGINAKNSLFPLLEDSRVNLSEGIIFCTTLKSNNSLDILSENINYLPYDVVALGHTLKINNFIPEKNFAVLMQRKIYTYNCISAVITYLGYFKGYTVYSDAANDKDINLCIQNIVHELNRCISIEYNVPIHDQEEFSKMAIHKFKNKNIVDTIDRNARDVDRKLEKTERIMAPLKIMEKHGIYSNELLLVVACAIFYGQCTNTLLKNASSYYAHLPENWKDKVDEYLELLQQEKTVESII